MNNNNRTSNVKNKDNNINNENDDDIFLDRKTVSFHISKSKNIEQNRNQNGMLNQHI
jgi:hypothetical protein